MREKEKEGSTMRIVGMISFLALLLILFSTYALGQEAGDLDGDGLPDNWEADHGLDGNNSSDAGEDPDGDGLNNTAEYLNGTDPNDPDTDGDQMDDGWEVENGLDPLRDDADEDPDGDDYTNLQEYLGDDGEEPIVDPSGPSDSTDPRDKDSFPWWWPGGGATDAENDEGAPASIAIFSLFLIIIVGVVVFILIIGFSSKL